MFRKLRLLKKEIRRFFILLFKNPIFIKDYLIGHKKELDFKINTLNERKNFLQFSKSHSLKYSKTWFLDPIGILNNFIKNQPSRILEIGAYEGMLSIWLYNKFKNAELHIVDPFLPDLNIENADQKRFKEVEKNFKFNISKFNNFDRRIYFYNTTSDNFFKTNKIFYDLIYVDGNHTPECCYRDIKNSFIMLNLNGIMVIDDIFLSTYKKSPLDCVYDFIKKHKNKIIVININSQNIIIKKIK